jgi:hypothetical protein
MLLAGDSMRSGRMLVTARVAGAGVMSGMAGTLSAMNGVELAGLEEINWAGLQHAYGPAAHVPGLLRALASGEISTKSTTPGSRIPWR